MPFIYTNDKSVSRKDSFNSTKDNPDLSFIDDKLQSTPQVVVKHESDLTKAARLAPPSRWKVFRHGLEEQIVRTAEGYVLDNWEWPNDKIKDKVRAAQFGHAAALCFPRALDDRIEIMCKLCMILVLVDDVLDHLSHEDGRAYNHRLITIMSGAVQPNATVAAERLLAELWTEMRAQDPELSSQLLDGVISWFAAMTEADRNDHSTLGSYLTYRERDVGMSMLSAMVRYALDIHLTPSEFDLIVPIETNFVRQYCCVNDVCSYDKEVRAAAKGHSEGSKICSGVSVLANEAGLPVEAAKRVLWTLAREYSDAHDRMARELLEVAGCSQELTRYMDGMRDLMSGNEEWCLTSGRYNDDVRMVVEMTFENTAAMAK